MEKLVRLTAHGRRELHIAKSNEEVAMFISRFTLKIMKEFNYPDIKIEIDPMEPIAYLGAEDEE